MFVKTDGHACYTAICLLTGYWRLAGIFQCCRLFYIHCTFPFCRFLQEESQACTTSNEPTTDSGLLDHALYTAEIYTLQ